MTSHDMVSLVRKKTGIKRVGHTGTLDPNAAGVLPICIGQATRVSEYLLENDKQYRVEMKLGITTDTQDAYGTITNQREVTVSSKEVEQALLSFVGEYDQVPPMYSALKVKGKKLYQLAREGIEVKRKSRRVTIYKIEIIKNDHGIILFDILCSKGTYVRTLCHDIGEKLGCGAVMSFLLRTSAGRFDILSAVTLEELNSMDDIGDIEINLKPMDFPLEYMPRVSINPIYERAAYNGNQIPIDEVPPPSAIGDIIRIYLKDNFIGIGIIRENDGKLHIKFSKLFA